MLNPPKRTTKHSECASGFCADGVCCDSACEGNCQACSAETKESGPDGTCGPAKKGLNALDVCSCTSDADCASNYVCDVLSETCVPKAAALCDGDHTLVASDGTETDCSPFKCSDTECKSSWVSVLDCVYPNECSSVTHTCLPPLDAKSNSSGCALGASPRARSSLANALALAVALLGACSRRATRAASRRSRNDADVRTP